MYVSKSMKFWINIGLVYKLVYLTFYYGYKQSDKRLL